VGQQLGVQVVGQEPVVAGKCEPGVAPLAAGLVGEGGQVQPDRPPLGPPDQLAHLRVGQPDPGRLQQGAPLCLVHGQLGHPDLHDLAAGPQQRHRQGRLAPLGKGDLGPCGQPQGELDDRVQAGSVLQGLQVVQDEGTGWVMADTAARNRGRTVARTETPGEARASNTVGSRGSTRSKTAARQRTSTTGSLSRWSTETHPTRGPLRAAHWASRVVLP
jgi:hypothetical protein